jgi:MFS family permease
MINRKLLFFRIFLGAFMISLSYGAFLSLPVFIKQIGGNEITMGWLLGLTGIGTIASVFLSKILFKKISPATVAGLGGIAYMLGAICFQFANQVGVVLILANLLLGIGWGFYFNASPYTLSLLANDKNRGIFFTYLSGFNILGIGLAPIIIKLIWPQHINFSNVFYGALLSSLSGALLFFSIPVLHPTNTNSNLLGDNNKLKIIFSGIALYPILMVFFGACAFTMMLNFQMTYADSVGMNYAYFFLNYSLAMFLSRVILGKFITRFNQYSLCIILLIIMCIGLFSFPYTISNKFLYSVSSALFGISYGLLYPTIQAIAVNSVTHEYRSDVITYFSLSYFIGVYAFPPLGGMLIVYFGYTTLIVVITFIAAIELLLSILMRRHSKLSILNAAPQ